MSSEYKYVWLNVITGQFSNSWDEITHKMSIGNEIKSDEFDKRWKLIKYQCLTDNNFEFYNQMELK